MQCHWRESILGAVFDRNLESDGAVGFHYCRSCFKASLTHDPTLHDLIVGFSFGG